MLKNNIDLIFDLLASKNPNPETELLYVNHFTLLVAIILSAQSTDKGVNLATKNLFAKITSPQEMVDLGEEVLKSYIKTIGLYNSKAKNIIAMSKILLEKYQGNIPETFEALISLPGVGRKTANVFLNCALGKHTIAVDTHVFRVSNRLGIAKGKNVDQVEDQLMQIVPTKHLKNAHHLLILHGRYICKAIKPDCNNCPLQKMCEYYNHNLL
jgi:endonuclease-3